MPTVTRLSKKEHKAKLAASISLKRGMVVRARYDSAQTTDENKRHWANADFLSPNASLIPAVRRAVRSRSRYEHANNSYAQGIVATLCDYVVGSGARLQLTSDDVAMNALVENKWREWTAAIGLDLKLQTIQKTMVVSGEAFAMLTDNPKLETESTMDVQLIETDQVADTAWTGVRVPEFVDGIKSDKWGNPIRYSVLKHHPGELFRIVHATDVDFVDAEHMLHLFEVDRPGQKRGMPLLTPALPLFAQLRRYTLAVLSAAEAAALPAGIIYTDAAPNDEVANVDALDTFEMDRNTWLTMPHGWNAKQFKAEHPTSTYAEFKHEILNEIARTVGMPFNIAAANSSEYNYASGRLDHQSFFRSIVVRRKRLAETVLDPLFKAWLSEMFHIKAFPGRLKQAMMPSGTLLGRARRATRAPDHSWFWDGSEHVDPAKEAKAQEIRLGNLTTTLAAEYARQGKDWEKEITQRAKEMDLLKTLGLTSTQSQPLEKDDDNDR